MGNRQDLRPPDLAAVSDQLEAWRQTRRAGEAIPDGLWGEAVRLAGLHGVPSVARALHLHYGKLRQRVKAPQPSSVSKVSKAKSAFVEVVPFSPDPVPRECVVELKRPDGASMVIRMASDEGLSNLCVAFWRVRA